MACKAIADATGISMAAVAVVLLLVLGSLAYTGRGFDRMRRAVLELALATEVSYLQASWEGPVGA